jgi:dephospho-CoA kinase
MSKRKIVTITGLSAVGKSTAAVYLQQKYGYEYIEGSSFLRKKIPELHGMTATEGTNKVKSIMQHIGSDIVVNEAVVPIMNTEIENIVYAGLRTCAGLEKLMKASMLYDRQLLIVYLTADHRTRLNRTISRDRTGEHDINNDNIDKNTISDIFDRMIPIISNLQYDNSGSHLSYMIFFRGNWQICMNRKSIISPILFLGLYFFAMNYCILKLLILCNTKKWLH